jgi:hypothetical protein
VIGYHNAQRFYFLPIMPLWTTCVAVECNGVQWEGDGLIFRRVKATFVAPASVKKGSKPSVTELPMIESSDDATSQAKPLKAGKRKRRTPAEVAVPYTGILRLEDPIWMPKRAKVSETVKDCVTPMLNEIRRRWNPDGKLTVEELKVMMRKSSEKINMYELALEAMRKRREETEKTREAQVQSVIDTPLVVQDDLRFMNFMDASSSIQFVGGAGLGVMGNDYGEFTSEFGLDDFDWSAFGSNEMMVGGFVTEPQMPVVTMSMA